MKLKDKARNLVWRRLFGEQILEFPMQAPVYFSSIKIVGIDGLGNVFEKRYEIGTRLDAGDSIEFHARWTGEPCKNGKT